MSAIASTGLDEFANRTESIVSGMGVGVEPMKVVWIYVVRLHIDGIRSRHKEFFKKSRNSSRFSLYRANLVRNYVTNVKTLLLILSFSLSLWADSTLVKEQIVTGPIGSKLAKVFAERDENIEVLKAKLAAQLCADPAPKEASQVVSVGKKSYFLEAKTLEASSGCIECDLAKIDKQFGIFSVRNGISAPQKIVLPVVERARVKREISYLTYYLSKIGDSSFGLEAAKSSLAQYKSKRDTEQSKLKKIETINKLLVSLYEDENIQVKDETLDLLNDHVNKLASDNERIVARSKRAIELSKKKLEKLNSPGVDKSSIDYQGSVHDNKETIDWAQKSLNKALGTLKAIERVQAWIGSPGAERLNKPQMETLTKGLKGQIEYGSDQIKMYDQEIANLESKIKQLTEQQPPSQGDASDLSKLRRLEESAHVAQESLKCGLSIAEYLALREYTGSGYMQLNRILRTGTEEEKVANAPFAETLQAALFKLRPYVGPVRRGTEMPEDVLKAHQPGQIIPYKAFTSSSINKGFGGSQKFFIKSKSGRYVDPLSSSSGELEVIFPKDTKFKVLERKRVSGVDYFVMEEISP